MKIIDVQTYLVNPSGHRAGMIGGKNWLFVRLETDAGIVGWGESYTQLDRDRNIERHVHDMGRYLDGRDPFAIKHFTHMVYDDFAGRRGSMDLYCALSGIEQEKTILLLYPDHPSLKLREVLFILQPNEKMETWFGHKLTKKKASEISGISNIQYLDSFETFLDEMLGHAENIYFNSNDYPKFKPDVENRDLRWAQKIKKDYPAHNYKRLAPEITQLRLQKEPEEIEMMKKACYITNKAFHRVLQFVKPVVHEYEVEAEMLHEFVTNRANGPAYPPIIASGKNALILHHIENDKTCEEGELLLMDFGAEYANYAADCTRTIPVSGKFTPKQKEYYKAVLRVQKEIQKHYVVGSSIERIGKEVLNLMEKELLDLGLITEKEIEAAGSSKPLVMKYLVHGIAHFIGLDVHDVGTRFEGFRPGMVLTCEPGLYIKEENLGIRIENDILITKDGPVNLMEDIPSDPDEIEELMNKK